MLRNAKPITYIRESMSNKNHYVDKKRLHEEIVKHLERVKIAEENGKPLPIPNDYIGRSIIDIANGIAKRYNFRGYSWLDEMIGDGIVAAVQAIEKYNPERSNNPYGYFTQAIVWSFLGRLKKENIRKERELDYMRNVLVDFYVEGLDGEDHNLNREEVISMFEN